MRADEPIEVALGASVGEQVKRLRRRLAKAKKKRDPDAVHDSRTSIRRVREALRLMYDSVFDRERTAALEATLHDLERALAKSRDTDVLRSVLLAYAKKHRADARGLEGLASLLDARRKKASRRARRDLDGHRDILRDVEKLLGNGVVVHRPRSPAKATPHLVRHFTHEALWKQYDAVLAYDVRRPPDAEILHAFRSACRRLRYTVELFAGALPEEHAGRIIADLRDLQARIGEMHDAHVAVILVDKWVRSGKLRATPELERFVEARERARDAARGSLVERFDEVLGPRFRAALVRAMEAA
jgi:CHAD domain-containing protein